MPVVVLHVVADAVSAGCAVAQVAEVAVLPVVGLVPVDGWSIDYSVFPYFHFYEGVFALVDIN